MTIQIVLNIEGHEINVLKTRQYTFTSSLKHFEIKYAYHDRKYALNIPKNYEYICKIKLIK